MSRVQVLSDTTPFSVRDIAEGPAGVGETLKNQGIGYRRHPITHRSSLSHGEILEHYRELVLSVIDHGKFATAEVAALEAPGQEGVMILRPIFLVEHTHQSPETRFILSGSACYYIHTGNNVVAVTVTSGDLLCIPAHVPHWFDVSPEGFQTIRFVSIGDDVVPTGSDIAADFPIGC